MDPIIPYEIRNFPFPAQIAPPIPQQADYPTIIIIHDVVEGETLESKVPLGTVDIGLIT